MSDEFGHVASGSFKSGIAEFRKIHFFDYKTHKNYFKIDHVTFLSKNLEKHSYSQKTMLYDDVRWT